MRNISKLALWFAFLAVGAVWWGGLTFYGTFVVPTGVEVLGSHKLQGFITQQVTHYLNALGVLHSVLSFIVLAIFSSDSKRWKYVAFISAGACLLAQATLIWMHGRMDMMLNTTDTVILEPKSFYAWHRIYLDLTAVHWFSGIVNGISMLRIRYGSLGLTTPNKK